MNKSQYNVQLVELDHGHAAERQWVLVRARSDEDAAHRALRIAAEHGYYGRVRARVYAAGGHTSLKPPLGEVVETI